METRIIKLNPGLLALIGSGVEALIPFMREIAFATSWIFGGYRK
ncbi:MAG TPA: hypothetical protein VK152_02765 [Paludibacter sp.]|nr:hypothetical protein [Paludibacter sp.]